MHVSHGVIYDSVKRLLTQEAAPLSFPLSCPQIVMSFPAPKHSTNPQMALQKQISPQTRFKLKQANWL